LEEPSLFPTQPSAPPSHPVPQQNDEDANAESVTDSTAPVSNVGGLQTLGAASAFQPASQNHGLSNQRPVGLGSSFQRNLILSKFNGRIPSYRTTSSLGRSHFDLAGVLMSNTATTACDRTRKGFPISTCFPRST
jgi:hypothetical protein